MELKNIDISFDVQSDSHGKDPDSASETLKTYHQLLWSKQLPNGESFDLIKGKGYYLKWKDFYLGSDSITVSFLNGRKPIKDLETQIPNFEEFKRDYWHETYTIGGSIIFPQNSWSMNRARGCHPRICDRWDLTLECIKRFYNQEPSPLDKALYKSESFFRLFIDFKGYVDFFLLQDCVDDNYNVKLWLNTALFETMPLPKTIDIYLKWIESQRNFVKQRGLRINDYCNHTH